MNSEPGTRWYAVRSLFRSPGDAESAYEERVTLWQASSSDGARSRAEAEAEEYADFAGVAHLSGFGQVYALADAPPRDGAEVFALTRDSDLAAEAYVDRFFATGRERDL